MCVAYDTSRKNAVPWILTTGVEWIWGLVGEFGHNTESIRPEVSIVIGKDNVQEEDLKALVQIMIVWVGNFLFRT
jgi:hypothetical protein